jgi:broad specificity phosphatase PhoE
MANLSGRFAYQSWDPPLSSKGQIQAQHVASYLHSLPITWLASSPLLRARETMAPLAQRLAMEPLVLPELVELNMGLWDGLVLDELKVSDATRFAAWSQDPENSPPPQGESILGVGRRVLAGLDRFFEGRPSGLMVATTHADCLKGVMLVVLDAPGGSARRISSPNIALLHLKRTPNGRWLVSLGSLPQPPAADG